MKSVMQQKRKSNRNNFKSIRVKEATKKEVDQFLKKINKNEHTGKVSFDDLIKFFMEKVTVENIQSLQLNSVNWEHEDKMISCSGHENGHTTIRGRVDISMMGGELSEVKIDGQRKGIFDWKQDVKIECLNLKK